MFELRRSQKIRTYCQSQDEAMQTNSGGVVVETQARLNQSA